ncbi:MAG: hypothetical protein PUC44_00450 [Eubacteriales bacterium]|nr:hypothetical protein [Eubacteriales bacterium]
MGIDFTFSLVQQIICVSGVVKHKFNVVTGVNKITFAIFGNENRFGISVAEGGYFIIVISEVSAHKIKSKTVQKIIRRNPWTKKQ